MMGTAKRVLTYMAGWGFILLGVVGLFLPILQGVLFLLIGLLILSRVSPWARNLLQKFQKRYPGPYKKVHALKEKLTARFRLTFRTKIKK